MARELAVVVRVESDDARRKLAAVDAQADRVTGSFKRMGAGAATATGHLGLLSTVTTNTVKSTNLLGSALGTAAGFLTGFGAAEAIDALMDFGRQTIAQADALTKLSDKTGIGTEALQRLQAVAEDSGNTLDQVTRAISQMQNRLADGGKPTIAALTQLGLSLETLRALRPEQQFIEIGKAIAQIEDPAKRTQLAWDLMGRSGLEVLPTLRAEIEKLAAAVTVVSDANTKTWDAFGDEIAALARWVKAQTTNIAGDLLRMLHPVERAMALREAFNTSPTLPTVGRPNLSGEPARPLPLPTDTEMREFERQSKVIDDRMRATADAAKLAAEAHKRFVDSVRSLTTDAVGARPGMGMIGLFAPDVQQRGEAFRNVLEGLNEDGSLVSRTLGDIAGKLHDVGQEAGVAQKEIERVRKATPGLGESLRAGFKELPSVITASIGSGGNPIKAAGSHIGSMLGQFASTSLTKALSGVSGIAGAIGGAFATALPVIGAFLGPVASFIGNKLFKTEERKVNDLRDAFQALNFGSLEDMARAFQRVGLTVDRVLNAKKVKDFDAAVAEFTRKLSFQQKAWSDVQAIAAKYGLTLEEFGPAWQRQELDARAQDLFKDYQLLTGAGADQVAVLTKMSAGINDYVRRAVTLGVEVPSAMRPILERMVELGLLTDASGKKVGSLEEAGITFAQTMTEGFKTVTDAIMEMVDALRLFLGLAPRAQAPVSGAPPEPPPLPEIPNMHTGGVVRPFRLRTDEVPIVAQTGEGIVSRTGMRTLGTQGLLGINRGLLPMPPGRSAWTPGGVDIGARNDGMRGGWMKRNPQHPWISIDARGAVMGSQAPAELARMVANHLAKGGTDQTRMRGALKVG